jgi:hypothetical protein
MHRKPFVVAGAITLAAGALFMASAQVAGQGSPPTTLAPGDNYLTCPGGANWSVSPAPAVGAGVFDATCPTTTTTTTTTVPTTTVPPTTAPPTTAPPTTAPPTTVAPTTTTTRPPTTTTTVPPAPPLWKPPQKFEWQWLLSGTLNFGSTTSMGTGYTAYDGTKAPATNPTVYDIDGILNSKATVDRLHSMGFKAICYIEVGSAGDYYSAATEGIPVTYYKQFSDAGVLGRNLPDYPAERFLNINAAATVRILEAMISQQCVAKGYDAVETDLDTTFDNLEGPTGFTITQANEETFLKNLAGYMNRNGEVWWAKNLSSTAKQSFVTNMAPYAAGTLEENPWLFNEVRFLGPFTSAKKPVLDVEFELAQSKYCADDSKMGIVGGKFNYALNGPRTPCDL